MNSAEFSTHILKDEKEKKYKGKTAREKSIFKTKKAYDRFKKNKRKNNAIRIRKNK